MLGGLVEQLTFVNQRKPPNVVRTHSKGVCPMLGDWSSN